MGTPSPHMIHPTCPRPDASCHTRPSDIRPSSLARSVPPTGPTLSGRPATVRPQPLHPARPSSSTDRHHPARPASPHLPTAARPALTATTHLGPAVRPPSGFRPTVTHMLGVSSSRQSGFQPTVPIPTRSTGPARLDHAELKCMAPVDSVSASPTVDHNHHTPARPTHVRTHVDTPVALHRTSSDHGMHMGFPCVHMQ